MRAPFRRWLPILPLYFLLSMLGPVAAVAGVLLAALALERLLRLVRMVTNMGVPADEAGQLILYLLPHYMSMALPAGVFIGLIIGLRRLQDRSELVVMHAFGIPTRSWLAPILVLSLSGSLLLVLLSGFVQADSRHQFRQHLNGIASRDIFAGLEAGALKRIGPSLVVRVEAIEEDGVYRGFFASEEVEPGVWGYLTAERARRTANPDEAIAENLILTKGRWIQEERTPQGRRLISQLMFEESTLLISRDDLGAPYGPRGQDERELTLLELWRGRSPVPEASIEPAPLRAELHGRLIEVLSLPVLAILAVPLARLGQGRQGRAWGLLLGVIILIFYEKILGLGRVMVESGQLVPLTGLWIPWLGLALLTLLLFLRYSGDGAAFRLSARSSGSHEQVNPDV